jgi:hypothetical protein
MARRILGLNSTMTIVSCDLVLKARVLMSADDMPGHFCVWITSPEAEFLGGRYVWAAWDVGDLVERKEEILKNDFLTFGLVH